MNVAAPLSPARAHKLIAARLAPDRKIKQSRSLGDTLIRMGCLSAEQVDRILEVQNKKGGVFGKIAVRLGFLTPQDLQYALGVQLGFLHEAEGPAVIPASLMVARNPYSPQAEQIKQMRTRLITGFSAETLKLFSISAAGARTDAAYVAANLAASFAQIGRQVLLIDADLRKPKFSKIFGEPDAPGLSDLIRGDASYEEICRATLIKNLNLLPAGAHSPDPQMLLGAKGFSKLLEQARKTHDIVIVLTAPFGAAADGEFVWAATRSVFALARKHHTRAKTLSQMRSAIRSVGAEIIGAAMVA